MKQKFLSVVLCVMLLAASLAIVPAAAVSAQQEEPPIRVGLRDPVNRLDPLAVENGVEALIVEQLFVGLTGSDENGPPIPELANSWEVSEDGLTWTFYLRDDVQWVDPYGSLVRPVMAYDVAYSLLRAMQVGNFEKVIQDVQAVDEFVVVIYLWTAMPDLATVLAVSPAAKVVPSAVTVLSIAPLQAFTNWYAGPYLLAESSGLPVQLRANPFWVNERGLQARPIQIEFIPDPMEALARYLRGELDLIELDPGLRNTVLQEQVLAEQVRDTAGQRIELYGMPAISSLLGSERSYLVKPYLLPVYSLFWGLDGFHLWQFDNRIPEVDIPGTTRILNDETLGALQSMSEDQAVLVFNRMTPQLSTIFINDILVGDSTLPRGNDVAPFGFLRRVMNKYEDGAGGVVIETAPAALEEAIRMGGRIFNTEIDLGSIYREESPRAFLAPQERKFVPISYAPPYAGLKVSIDQPIFDADDDPATKNDQVRARGWVNIAPGASLELALFIQNHQLQSFHFANTLQESSQLELYSNVDVLSFEKRVEVKRFIFTPLTIFIGPLPVVITPQLSVFVGANGKVSVGVSMGISQSSTIQTGVDYQSGSWNQTFSINDNHISPLTTEIKESAKAGVFAGPQLSIMIYGVAGPYGKNNWYLSLSGGPYDTPLWKLTGGINGELGAKVEILSYVVASYTVPITILPEQVLAEAGAVIPTPTVIPPAPTPTPTPGEDPPQTCGSIWWPPGCWTWWIWVIVIILGIIILLAIFG